MITFIFVRNEFKKPGQGSRYTGRDTKFPPLMAWSVCKTQTLAATERFTPRFLQYRSTPEGRTPGAFNAALQDGSFLMPVFHYLCQEFNYVSYKTKISFLCI
jgi:hypothetical protein